MKSDELLLEVRRILSATWQVRPGRRVPSAEDVRLGNDAVTLDAAVLYADLTDSTALVDGFKAPFAAEVYKTYLVAACRIVRENGGEITAFDGDRVMSVFVGDSGTAAAAKTALQINFFVREINNAIRNQYSTTSYTLAQTIGIDRSSLFVAKTGIRASNDLVWVGRAANYAAKLCALGSSDFPTYITEGAFKTLDDPTRFGGTPRQEMWERRIWTEKGIAVYRSNWWWKF